MKATIKVEKEVDCKTLKVSAGVRYWEDTEVCGVADMSGDLIPCRQQDRWCPIIDIDTGIIRNWKKGQTAEVHYKVCDDGSYFILDENDNVIVSIEEDYVPEIMCPKGGGYGDYIIMDINEDGQIMDWEFTLQGFIDDEA